ncbi:Radical S-adenosyl methionine domain-containing protein 2, partial [Bienertia sinuspersici]
MSERGASLCMEHTPPVPSSSFICGVCYLIKTSKARFLFHIQSAERWRGLEKDAGIQNFDLHGFRAVFQMVCLVLDRYYQELLLTSPSIGRQGKALRRHQKKSFPDSSDSA